MSPIVKLLGAILVPLMRILIPEILKELKKHGKAEMLGGGEEVRNDVNDSVDRAIDGT